MVWPGFSFQQARISTRNFWEYLVDSNSLPAVKTSPLRLLKVRQAINYGFDRRKMMTYLRNSIGTPAESGFIPPGLPSFRFLESSWLSL